MLPRGRYFFIMESVELRQSVKGGYLSCGSSNFKSIDEEVETFI